VNSDDGSLPTVRCRVPYFERPKQPRDWRFWVGGAGKSLIVLGLLMFAFVAYQLWGTGIQTSQAQDDLHSQFQQGLQSTTTSTTTTGVPASTVPSSTTPVATTTTQVPVAPSGPALASGTPIAQLKIASIGLDWTVVQGVGRSDLKKGPGHFPETPLPGQLGNAAIAGHRTTYGQPFRDLDRVKPGDLIDITTLAGHYIYKVSGTTIVTPHDYVKVIPTRDRTKATLVLATCNPAFSTKQRLIVHAELVLSKSDQVFAPPAETTPTSSVPDTTAPATTGPGSTSPGTTTGSTTTVAAAPTTTLADGTTDAFSQGWFADSSAIWQSILWGLALVGVSLGAYLIGKRFRRLWVSFLVGAVPFVVVLYFFFENVNRLLPPSL
jgi:sortase A